ncbi:MAG: undecaprenyl-diphosphate phosphatase, partial [Solirubrobacteraceae bacterium]
MLTAAATHHQDLITIFQAIVLGILQGATELFPISSLGHTVLFPSLFGWDNIVRWQSQPESPWLAFVVMLHVGSAIGLLIYFWRTWLDIIGGFFRTLARR